MAEYIGFLNLLLVPIAGLLWRISGQLAHLDAKTEAHGDRLSMLERLTITNRRGQAA